MLLNIIAANVIISLISLVGLFYLVSRKLFNKQNTHYLVSFAAGVMLSTAFVSMLPESLEGGDTKSILLATLGGIVFGFFLERFLLWYHHHHEDTHNIKPTAFLVVIGDAIHNFVDGLAIAATFLVSPIVGLSATLAIAFHELPQEFADFSVLLNCGLDKKKAVFYNFLSALTAVIGGILGFYFLQKFEMFTPYTIAVSAGIFIYISSADLIPELHQTHKKGELISQVLPFIFGIILMMVLNRVFGTV